MRCVFFGHRDTPSGIQRTLRETVNALIEEGVRCFCVGNNGNFDLMVQTLFAELAKERADVCLGIWLSRIDEIALCGDQSLTVFPEGLERTPPRFAVARRNELMLKDAKHVICYTRHTPSYSAQWVEKAKRKGIRVINLAEQSISRV